MMQSKDIRTVLSTVSKNSCPYELNFHCHTTFSDGSLSPISLIQQATELNIKHIAITDHHSIKAYKHVSDWIKSEKDKGAVVPTIWSGIEISCLLRKCLVHVIGLNFNPFANSMRPYVMEESTIGTYLQAKTVVDSIHDSGGLAILAHPARYRLSFKELIDESLSLGFDGAESWYDYEFNSIWKPTDIICDQIDNLLAAHKLIRTCGTDTHGYSLKGR